VAELASYDGTLIAGGNFGGGLAKWDGSQWTTFGGGATGYPPATPSIAALMTHDGELVVGGRFKSIGGQLVSSLARWDGAQWQAFGSGVATIPTSPGASLTDPSVGAIGEYHGEVVVGGSFDTAGGQISAHFARWSDTGIPWFAQDPESQDVGAYKCWVYNACGAAPSEPALLTVTCYADCNANGVLGVGDFACFQSKFVQGDPYADCNSDGALNAVDFGCFQTAFITGCP
jgi:hypothetical protein